MQIAKFPSVLLKYYSYDEKLILMVRKLINVAPPIRVNELVVGETKFLSAGSLELLKVLDTNKNILYVPNYIHSMDLEETFQ